MNTRLTHLKIKIKYLTAESKIIRHEEGKALKTDKPNDNGYNSKYESLRQHRKGVVGVESRHSLLAYGFLRGIPYQKMEPSIKEGNDPNWAKVERNAKRFYTKRTPESDFEKEWKEWLDEAKSHVANHRVPASKTSVTKILNRKRESMPI